MRKEKIIIYRTLSRPWSAGLCCASSGNPCRVKINNRYPTFPYVDMLNWNMADQLEARAWNPMVGSFIINGGLYRPSLVTLFTPIVLNKSTLTESSVPPSSLIHTANSSSLGKSESSINLPAALVLSWEHHIHSLSMSNRTPWSPRDLAWSAIFNDAVAKIWMVSAEQSRGSSQPEGCICNATAINTDWWEGGLSHDTQPVDLLSEFAMMKQH